MNSKFDLRGKMISVYLNLVFYVFLFIKISSIFLAAADFWQVRTRVHMVLKTSCKITFLLLFNT